MPKGLSRRHLRGMRVFVAEASVFIGLSIAASEDVSVHAAESIQLLRVTSAAFEEGTRVPTRYTCDGYGWSPPLHWSGLPSGTGSVAVLVDDRDAPRGRFAQWLVYDLDPAWDGLDEGANLGGTGGEEGKNGYGTIGWAPLCPKGNGQHHYFFRVLALRGTLFFRDAPDEADLVRAACSRVIAEGSLVATYQRQVRP